MSGARSHGRRAGILVPLFSLSSSRGWGIGEIGDIEPMIRWLERAGQRVLQLLPINEMPLGETSPYSPLSAMAIDPQFITLEALEDFVSAGGEHGLEPALQRRLRAVRASGQIDYANVRALKHAALRRSFEYFRDAEWMGGTRRASAFRAYVSEQAWWLDDYALFRALHAAHGEKGWTTWPAPLRDREPRALALARQELADDVRYRQYVQWVAADQWGTARDSAGEVALFGDLPFMVSADSADVWARQDEFRLDASVGVPPDAFSATGQDWGLPVYRWEVQSQRGFEWLRHRSRRNAELYDGYRVDHVVGFYRTYFRPVEGEPGFSPAGEAEQITLGERLLALFRDAGAEVTAEDLGTVPDYVRESLTRLAVPGYKVQRWERYWDSDGQPFKDPRDFPALAVATSGTHDTEPMAVWWEQASGDEKRAVLDIPSIRERVSEDDRARALGTDAAPHQVTAALLESLFASGADLLILPVGDVFGWRDRINQPATVTADNWTWKLPWPVDRLPLVPEASAMAAQLHEWSRRHGR